MEKEKEYVVIVPEQYFYFNSEEDAIDFTDDLKHAARKVECQMEETEVR